LPLPLLDQGEQRRLRTIAPTDHRPVEITILEKEHQLNWLTRWIEKPPTPQRTDPEQIAAAIRAALQIPPPWIERFHQAQEPLLEMLDRVAESAGSLDEFRRALRIKVETMQTDKAQLESAFADLQRLVSTGQACPNCRDTRAKMYAEMEAALQRVYELPADEQTGIGYATRGGAYQAGRQYTVHTLQAIIKEARSKLE
jgi:bacterioferritin-associated ferredoxin